MITLRERTSVQTLAGISKVLNSPIDNERLIKDALRFMALEVSAGGAALIKKHFIDERQFSLGWIGSWTLNGGDTLQHLFESGLTKAETIPRGWWDQLESHEIVFVKDPLFMGLGEVSNIILVPLFLDDNLYGFIAVWNVKKKNFSGGPVKDFMAAVGYVFELWISKGNIEKRFHDTINFIPTPMIAMNSKGVTVLWNKATEAMTGWDAKRVLGKGDHQNAVPFYNLRRTTVLDLILNPDPDWESKYLEFRKEKDGIFATTYCPALPGGGAFVSCKVSLLYDANNRTWGAIQMIRDITREREIEKNLLRSESMYRAITDFAGIGMMLFRKNQILYCNEHLLKFVGVSEIEMTPMALIQWAYPEDREEIVRTLENLFSGKIDVVRFEFRAQNYDEVRYYSCFAQVLEYEDQSAIHLILDDITEQRKLAHKARLNELRMYHDDRLTALGTMAAGIAHELNQPLNTIRVLTDGLLFGRDEGWPLDQEEIFEILKMISEQVLRMSEVIQNIRNFAREDRVEERDDINPNEAVKSVFSMIGRQLEAHGIQVEKDLSPNLPPLKTSRNRLEQVIMNLVVNAQQALAGCHHGEKQLWVRTGVRSGLITIEVGDNATGIPQGHMMKIFDPFFTTKEVGKGTGLGLSISQSIVTEFGGRIEVLNNYKGGATFIINASSYGVSV